MINFSREAKQITKALNQVKKMALAKHDTHRQYYLDQIVRALTDCEPVAKEALAENGQRYMYFDMGESNAYLDFVKAIKDSGGEWYPGVRPFYERLAKTPVTCVRP